MMTCVCSCSRSSLVAADLGDMRLWSKNQLFWWIVAAASDRLRPTAAINRRLERRLKRVKRTGARRRLDERKPWDVSRCSGSDGNIDSIVTQLLLLL